MPLRMFIRLAVLFLFVFGGCGPKVNVTSGDPEPVPEIKALAPALQEIVPQIDSIEKQARALSREVTPELRPDAEKLEEEIRQMRDRVREKVALALAVDEKVAELRASLAESREKYKKLADDWVRVDQERKTAWGKFQQEQAMREQEREQARKDRDAAAAIERELGDKRVNRRLFGGITGFGALLVVLGTIGFVAAGVFGSPFLRQGKGVFATAVFSGFLISMWGTSGLLLANINAWVGLCGAAAGALLAFAGLAIWMIRELRKKDEDVRVYRGTSLATIRGVEGVKQNGLLPWDDATKQQFESVVAATPGVTQEDVDRVIKEAKMDLP